MLCADANFEVNTRSIYARNYDFLSVAIKKISTVVNDLKAPFYELFYEAILRGRLCFQALLVLPI